MKGRKPKPQAQKDLEGNPGKRAPRREPKFTPRAPECPSWLTPEAKAEWKRVVTELDAIGMLQLPDRAALATFCQQWAFFKEAVELVKRDGLVLLVQPVTYMDVGDVDPDMLEKMTKAKLMRLAARKNVYCSNRDRKRDIALAIADAEADRGGVLIATTIYVNAAANPMLKTAKDSATIIRQLATEFGLTPVARARLEVPEIDDDEWKDLFGPAAAGGATITRMRPRADG